MPYPPPSASTLVSPRRFLRAWGLVLLLAPIAAFSASCTLHGGGHGAEPTAAPQPPASQPPASTSATAQAYAGTWRYVQSCGWQHSADLEFETADGSVRGRWSDGHRAGGQSGELRGESREGRLFLRFCRNDVAADHAEACPRFGAEAAYAVREGDDLTWYRKSGAAGYQPYLRLHRVIEGRDVPADDQCPDQD